MTATLCLLMLGYAASVIECSASVFIQVGLMRLDAIPALICWYSLRQNNIPTGIVAITLLGLILSAFSTIPVYAFPVSYTVGFLTMRYIAANMIALSNWQIYLFTGFVSLEIIVLQMAASGNLELVWPWGFLQALIDVATAPFFYWIFNRILTFMEHINTKETTESNG